jgi:ketosteroid isomerase-like protein
LKLAKTFIDALTRKDVPKLLSMLHDKVMLEAPYPLAPGEDVVGARRCTGAAVGEYIEAVAGKVDRIQFKNVIWRTTNDGLALFEADGDLTYPDGRPYRNIYLMVFEAADGKIVRWREYFSPIIWARAYGAPLDSLPS